MVQKSGVHQLRLVVYPNYLRRVLAPSQVVVWDFFHQQYHQFYEGGPLISMVSEYIHLEFNMSPSSNCRNTFRVVDLALNQAAKPWFHQYLDPAWYHLWRFVSENVSQGQICNLDL